MREIREDLPPGLLPRASRARARLRSPAIRASTRWPWAFVEHTDSRFDPETLRRFVRAYQRVAPADDRRGLGHSRSSCASSSSRTCGGLAEAIVEQAAARERPTSSRDRLLGIDGRPPADARRSPARPGGGADHRPASRSAHRAAARPGPRRDQRDRLAGRAARRAGDLGDRAVGASSASRSPRT